MEESLDNNWPSEPLKPKMNSQELSGLVTLLGDAGEQPAECSCGNRDGKLAESPQLALEDEEFEDMIPISAAAILSNDYDEGIDPKSYKSATQSALTETWNMVMKEELDANGQHYVFGYLVELPDRRKASPCEWVYMIQNNGAGNVWWLKARLVCSGNHWIKRLTNRACMDQLIPWATLCCHMWLLPRTILRSISWMYAWLSWKLTW